MPTVLLTGSAGQVGRAVGPLLEARGWTVRPFDLANGENLRDERAVLLAATGCDAVVHAGAITHDSGGTPAEIFTTNVLGTWHVLLAAEAHQLSRVVVFYSTFVHVDDVASATERALVVEGVGHIRVLLCGTGPFDTSRAASLLGWQPAHTPAK